MTCYSRGRGLSPSGTKAGPADKSWKGSGKILAAHFAHHEGDLVRRLAVLQAAKRASSSVQRSYGSELAGAGDRPRQPARSCGRWVVHSSVPESLPLMCQPVFQKAAVQDCGRSVSTGVEPQLGAWADVGRTFIGIVSSLQLKGVCLSVRPCARMNSTYKRSRTVLRLPGVGKNRMFFGNILEFFADVMVH